MEIGRKFGGLFSSPVTESVGIKCNAKCIFQLLVARKTFSVFSFLERNTVWSTEFY